MSVNYKKEGILHIFRQNLMTNKTVINKHNNYYKRYLFFIYKFYM